MTATYVLMLRRMLRPRAVPVVASVHLVFLVLGLLVRGHDGDRVLRGLSLVHDLGLSLLVPLVALVAAHLGLGRWVEERTIVLLWARPVPRAGLAVAAWAVAATVVVVSGVLPLVVAAAVTGVDGLAPAATVAAVPAALAYAALFTWGSGYGRQALLAGAAYILIWEGWVAPASDAAAWLSLRSHAASLAGARMGLTLEGTVASAPTAAAAVAVIAGTALVLLWVRMVGRGFADPRS